MDFWQVLQHEEWLHVGAALAALTLGFFKAYRSVAGIARATASNGNSRDLDESLRDVVDRIDYRLEQQESSLREITSELLPGIEEQLAFQQASMQLSGDITKRNVFWTDKDGHNIFVNRTYCRSLGYLKEDLMDLKWHQIVHREDHRLYLLKFHESLRVHGRFEASVRLLRSDGAIVPASVRCEPVVPKGVFRGMAGEWEAIG